MDDALLFTFVALPSLQLLLFAFISLKCSQLPAGSPIPVIGSQDRLGLSDILGSISKGSKQRLIYSKEMKYIIMNKLIDFSLRK